MAIDSQLPAWLQQRASFTSSGVTQGAQVGFNMGIQLRQQARFERAQKLQEEVVRLAMEEKERIAEGTVAATRVLSEMGRTGGYNDPVLKGQFWDIVSKNPKFAGSPVFKDIMDTFQNAEQAQSRAQLEMQRQQSITERNQDSIDSRFDLFAQKLDGMVQMEGLKQENREALAGLKSELDILKQSLQPVRPGQLFHDLSETDMAQMRSELDALSDLYKKGDIKGTKPGLFGGGGTKETPSEELLRRQGEVRKKYDSKRVGTPRPIVTGESPVPPPPGERVPGTVYQTPKGRFMWNGTGWEEAP